MQSKIPDIFVISAASSILILAFITFIFIIMIEFKKKQTLLTKNLKILQLNQDKSILNAQLEIQEETFKHISQEIHDNISLSLTLAKLNLNTLSLAETGKKISAIESSIDLISKALSDLNDISKSMDTDLIESQGLISALKYEADLIRKAGTYDIELEIEGNPVYMESSKELLIFRMIQEACNNIIKHAEADQIRIMLNYTNDHLKILVCDNGKGFDTQLVFGNATQKRTSGLRNIKNRASLINATVVIESNPASGTKLEILIPINTNHENR